MRYGVPLVFYSLSATQTTTKALSYYEWFTVLLQNCRKLMETPHFMNENKIIKVQTFFVSTTIA